MVFKCASLILRKRAQRVKRRKLGHLMLRNAIGHHPASNIGRSVSLSFIIPSRVRVFTVPSG